MNQVKTRTDIAKNTEIPLGRVIDNPDKYTAEVLCAIPRADSRGELGVDKDLPFDGVDIWNAWELTWLGKDDRPEVATAEIRVPADSPYLIESKSLKLYLNSFAMSRFSSATELVDTLSKDLSSCAGGHADVRVLPLACSEARRVSRMAGACLDSMAVKCSAWEVDADLLRADPDTLVHEDVHSHLLRSLCPVTAQPDIGSLQISYRGPRIDRASLLRYVVSYRQHSDFHEACIERMFVDLMSRCAPLELSIYARYQRRGGIDINPFRTNSGGLPLNLRLWRQ